MAKKKNRQERRASKQLIKSCQNSGLEIRTINPLTKNQSQTFDSFGNHNMFLYGMAGTGKTFVSLYLALDEVLDEIGGKYNRVVIVRSVVPTRDMGFLPGNSKEKAKEYEAPYNEICSELFGRGDAYSILKQKGYIEFMSTSFVRGITLRDCIIIVDECQNMTAGELNSIITRVGDNCKIIFCGDMRQCDLNTKKEMSGLSDFMKVIRNMKSFSFIEFGIEDICRSQMVKEYIIARYRLEDQREIQPLYT